MLKRLLRRLSGRRTVDYRAAVGGHWDEIGKMQLDFLRCEGLEADHYLLDVACGSFRAGRFLIPYLRPGHYHGFDGDPELLRAGTEEVLRPLGLLERSPRIQCLHVGPQAPNFAAVLGRAFDYIWIHALFDHIPPAAIESTLRGLAEVLAPGGRLYATIFLNPYGPGHRDPIVRLRSGSTEGAVTTFPDREYWHHTLEFFRELCDSSRALTLDACLDDYPHPLGLKVLRFVHPPERPGH